MNKLTNFRGAIAVNQQIKCRLSTNTGFKGYRVKKFQIISSTPGTGGSVEYVAKVYSTKVAGVTALVDFDDPTLIATVFYQDRANASSNTETIIIDTKVFNQDCFVTLADAEGGAIAGNFYLELEQVKLDSNEAAVATLTNLKNRS
mgnify:FL=1|jgi:hypothetical protein|tara:strand:+ start:329 stop:766 length:438 start_codon:yes stop_codon:yes gene_type:complete